MFFLKYRVNLINVKKVQKNCTFLKKLLTSVKKECTIKLHIIKRGDIMPNLIFGERIRELRETRDLSMQELANYLEVSKSSVNMWENAGVVPREPILKKYQKLLM